MLLSNKKEVGSTLSYGEHKVRGELYVRHLQYQVSLALLALDMISLCPSLSLYYCLFIWSIQTERMPMHCLPALPRLN